MKQKLCGILLVFGVLTTGGCGILWSEQREPHDSPEVVVVNECHFTEGEGEEIVVTRGWILMRIQLEQDMERALSSCLDKIDRVNHDLKLCLEK